MLVSEIPSYSEDPAPYTLRIGSRLKLVNEVYILGSTAPFCIAPINIKTGYRHGPGKPVENMTNISKQEAINILGNLKAWSVVTKDD